MGGKVRNSGGAGEVRREGGGRTGGAKEVRTVSRA